MRDTRAFLDKDRPESAPMKKKCKFNFLTGKIVTPSLPALRPSIAGPAAQTLVKGGGARDPVLKFPRAETRTHYITMGMDPDLDQCAVKALREMIALLGEKAGLSHADAYMLCSLAGDLHVTQTVNGSKGVHMMMQKSFVDAA